MTRRVTVLGTGGTIASLDAEGGAAPDVTGEDLVAAVPELTDHAELTVEQVVQRPSFDLSFDDVLALAAAAGRAASAGADGVVVTHGTDTMEESAYLLDHLYDGAAPVVFTGAQRRPDEVSPDGPGNLLTAVEVATHDAFVGEGGVYVAFNERVHAAADVTKEHTTDVATFASPGSGPVATLGKHRIRCHRSPGRRCQSFAVDAVTASVVVVPSGLGVDGDQVRRAVAAGVDGVVVDGTGLGNASPGVAAAVSDACSAGVPVVVTSRCRAGQVVPVYGGAGGGSVLSEAGSVHVGPLPAHKARLTLALALSANPDADPVSVAEEAFSAWR